MSIYIGKISKGENFQGSRFNIKLEGMKCEPLIWTHSLDVMKSLPELEDKKVILVGSPSAFDEDPEKYIRSITATEIMEFPGGTA